ncbi:MAG: PEP-CTERM sorting domain-containing protein [Planctomycetota bacterium]|nr:PEP-CTERM sorting domain-containing protein [Planctomycetota bacterium]
MKASKTAKRANSNGVCLISGAVEERKKGEAIMRQVTYVTLCLLLALVVPAQADFVIEDGASVADWSDISGGINAISSANEGTTPNCLKVVVYDSPAPGTWSNAIKWTGLTVGDDWTEYTTLEFDMKTTEPEEGLVRFRWKNNGTWIDEAPVRFDPEDDGLWHRYSIDISGIDRDDVEMVYLYLSTRKGSTDYLSYTAYFDNITLTPEPATMALLMLGVPFALRRRRR